MKLGFSPQILEKCSNIRFHKNPSSGRLAVPWGRSDEQIDMMTLTVAFRDFANANKRCYSSSKPARTYSLIFTKAEIFFLLGATTLAESWPSQKFLSIWGDHGLVLSILWVSSSSGRSWHRLPIGTWVFLLVFLWMVSICVFSLQYYFQAFYLCVQTNSIFGF